VAFILSPCCNNIDGKICQRFQVTSLKISPSKGPCLVVFSPSGARTAPYVSNPVAKVQTLRNSVFGHLHWGFFRPSRRSIYLSADATISLPDSLATFSENQHLSMANSALRAGGLPVLSGSRPGADSPRRHRG